MAVASLCHAAARAPSVATGHASICDRVGNPAMGYRPGGIVAEIAAPPAASAAVYARAAPAIVVP